MKPKLIFIAYLYSALVFGQPNYLEDVKHFQDSLSAFQKDPATSQIIEEELPDFDQLRFFNVDKSYCIPARIVKTDHPQTFTLSYSRSPDAPHFISYGRIVFTLDSIEYILTVFKDEKWHDDPDYERHLFLPFKDWTNGPESYGGGRFLDIFLPEDGNMIMLDFNLSYNPPCAYDFHMACPLIPESNYIETEVKAGILAY